MARGCDTSSIEPGSPGIPLPHALSPSIESYVDAGETGWSVVVRIFAPMLGELVHYEGWIEPE